MAVLRFKSKIQIQGINPYVDVSQARAIRLKKDWRKPMPVLVRVNGKPDDAWPINMIPKGDGSFYLYLHGKVRKASDTKVGDEVNIEVAFDNTYKNGPQHDMPDWFQAALEKNSTAYANWQNLSPSRQKEVLRYFAGLKSDEAKTRNKERVIYVLSGKTGRFMAREWRNGS